jgi:uncharacterized MAPEG superfamily protein
MTTEMTMLTLAVALLVVLIFVQAGGQFQSQGKNLAGNRDNLGPPSAWEGRTRRALYNHIEGLAMFAPLALIAAVSGISNGVTVLAAEIFLGARVAHAICYLFGFPALRSLSFGASLIAIIMMFLALFGIIG